MQAEPILFKARSRGLACTLITEAITSDKSCVVEHSLGCVISQHVDVKQLSSPTKQSQAMTNHN